MSMLKKIRTKSMLAKQYVARTVTYVSLINSGMILFLFLIQLKGLGIVNFDIESYFIPIFIGGLICLFILGWLEIKLFKGIQEELRISFQFTPQLVEMQSKLNDLWEDRNGKK